MLYDQFVHLKGLHLSLGFLLPRNLEQDWMTLGGLILTYQGLLQQERHADASIALDQLITSQNQLRVLNSRDVNGVLNAMHIIEVYIYRVCIKNHEQ